MILIIDNYDSFVHNLARYVREAGADVSVIRNDAASARELVRMAPAGVILSPGPKAPTDAGVSLTLLDLLPQSTPQARRSRWSSWRPRCPSPPGSTGRSSTTS